MAEVQLHGRVTVLARAQFVNRLWRGKGLGSILLRGLAGTGAVRIASMALSFAVGVQLARRLGVSGYGYYGIALSVITICGIPGELGLPRLITREVAAAAVRHDNAHIFGVLRWADRLAMRMSVIVGVGLAVAALVLSRADRSPVAMTLLVGAPIVPFMVLSRLRGGALQGLQHIVRGQVPANLVRPIAQSLLLFAAYLAGMVLTPASAMVLNVFASAGAFAIAAYWLAQRLPAGAPAELLHGGRKWIASSIPMALTDGMRMLQTELTILLLGLATTPTEVGLFRVGAATAFAAATPIAVINHVAFPVISQLHAKQDYGRLQRAVTKLAQAQFSGVLLLSLPLLIAPDWLLTQVFGAAYAPAGPALRILTVAQIINAGFGPNVALLNMTHNERRVTKAMACGLVINLAAVIILSAAFARVGAALGVVLGLTIWNGMTWLDGKRILRIDSSILPVRRPPASTCNVP
jgi:O-antigen/teichoic acid export membrane protein